MIVRDLYALTKPGITGLVVVTAGAGFVAGAEGRPAVALLAHTLLGTALVAGGTNALNQWWERKPDALMRRTRNRPLPAGRLAPPVALVFALGLAAVGVAELVLFVGWVPALLAAVTLASYALIYTPLKRRTSAATLVGAIPGALPIVGGWAASGRPLDAAALALVAVLFLWQIPHFLALAWLYRDDYARAGFHMLTTDDPSGRAAGRQALLYAALVWGAGIAVFATGIAGSLYLVAALGLGAAFVWTGASFARAATRPAARRLFLGSIAYLPLLLAALTLDRVLG